MNELTSVSALKKQDSTTLRDIGVAMVVCQS